MHHNKTRGPLLNVFVHDQAVILGKRERLSKILVTLVTGLAGVLLLVTMGLTIAWGRHSFYDAIFMLSLCATYYFGAWIFPWFEYGDGLSERKAKKLRYWMCSFSAQAFLAELYTFANVRCMSYEYRSTYTYNCYSYVGWMVIAGLVALPAFLIVLATTLMVYVNFDQAVPVVQLPMFERSREGGNLGWWKHGRNGPRDILRSWRRNGRGRNRARMEGRERQIEDQTIHETMADRNQTRSGECDNMETRHDIRIVEVVNQNERRRSQDTERERRRSEEAESERRRSEEAESEISWASWGRAQYNAAMEGGAAVTRNWWPVLAQSRQPQPAAGGSQRNEGGIRDGRNDEEQEEEAGEAVVVDHTHVVNLIVNFPDQVSDIVEEDSFIEDNRNSAEEDEPPSYGDVELDDLPSYSQLGTKRIQIGNKIIVMDKKLKINTFQQV